MKTEVKQLRQLSDIPVEGLERPDTNPIQLAPLKHCKQHKQCKLLLSLRSISPAFILVALDNLFVLLLFDRSIVSSFLSFFLSFSHCRCHCRFYCVLVTPIVSCWRRAPLVIRFFFLR